MLQTIRPSHRPTQPVTDVWRWSASSSPHWWDDTKWEYPLLYFATQAELFQGVVLHFSIKCFKFTGHRRMKARTGLTGTAWSKPHSTGAAPKMKNSSYRTALKELEKELAWSEDGSCIVWSVCLEAGILSKQTPRRAAYPHSPLHPAVGSCQVGRCTWRCRSGSCTSCL